MKARGFTLLEVLFAMAILTIGGTSLIALFAYNLQLAARAREEVVINVIQRDVSVRNQIAAYTRGNADFLDNSWLVTDRAAYDRMAETEDRKWENIPAYRGYHFWVKELVRQGPAWGAPDPNSPTYGLELMDAQFVDWDGYGWIDLNGDGVKDADEDFGLPAPSHRVHYDSRGMRNYFKRLKGIIVWNAKYKLWDETAHQPTMTADEVEDAIRRRDPPGEYHVFYFTIYNPDTQKW